jgi:hypothetical protein
MGRKGLLPMPQTYPGWGIKIITGNITRQCYICGVEDRMAHRSLFLIAREIARDWKKPYFGAVPYIEAMMTMDTPDDAYGCDPGREIVLYFLANANTWRGEVARRVKSELKGMVK